MRPTREVLSALMDAAGYPTNLRCEDDYELARMAYELGWNAAEEALIADRRYLCSVCGHRPKPGQWLVKNANDHKLRCGGCIISLQWVREIGLDRIEAHLGR